jgi:hypothetical protein
MVKTAQENLIGKRVKVNIKVKSSYTNDLYNAIQGEEGEIIQKMNTNGLSTYDNAYIVRFGKSALDKYKKTHSGQWSNADRMEWWTERKDFKVIS